MKLGFLDYIKAAFNAKPIGMFVPPNWIGLGLVAVLGLINPGLWVMGLGLELGYLLMLGTNARFQNLVNGMHLSRQRKAWQSKLSQLVYQLLPHDQERYRSLEKRCQSVLDQQKSQGHDAALQAQADGLGRLLWMYLRLLLTRQAIMRIQQGEVAPPIDITGVGIDGTDNLEELPVGRRRGRPSSAAANAARTMDDLQARFDKLQEQLKDTGLNVELRKSLSGQAEILQQRLTKKVEARDKLVYMDAELTRIQEQVELIREQAIVSADPTALSQRIDEISASLGGTTQWISQQQQIFGKVEDLMTEPPMIVMPQAVEEKQ